MATGVGFKTATVLVPLLLVIVERLTNFTRGIAETPEELLGSEPLLLPGKTSDENQTGLLGVRSRVPQLGRLNYLHTTNMLLLSGAFVIVAAVGNVLVKNVLGLVVILVWIQLPVLEIDEYGAIRDEISSPKSLYLHIAGTLAVAGLLAGGFGFEPGLFLERTSFLAPDIETILNHKTQLTASLLVAVCLFGTSFGFLWLFEHEAKRAVTDENESWLQISR